MRPTACVFAAGADGLRSPGCNPERDVLVHHDPPPAASHGQIHLQGRFHMGPQHAQVRTHALPVEGHGAGVQESDAICGEYLLFAAVTVAWLAVQRRAQVRAQITLITLTISLVIRVICPFYWVYAHLTLV